MRQVLTSFSGMFSVLIGCILVFLVNSCNHSVDKNPVTLDDISATSDRDYSEDTSSVKKTIELPESPLIQRLGDTLFAENHWKKWDTTLFADRFGPIVSEKWIAVSSKDSFTIQHYRFKDSLRTKNAFFNLLDCFGKKCVSYVVGANIRIPKRTALFYVGEEDLFLIEASHAMNAEKIHFILSPDKKKQHWIYVVDVPLKGKTVWKSIQSDKETLITEHHEDS